MNQHHSWLRNGAVNRLAGNSAEPGELELDSADAYPGMPRDLAWRPAVATA